MAVMCRGEGCERFKWDVQLGDDPSTSRSICTGLGLLAAEMEVFIDECPKLEAPNSVIEEAARRGL